MHNTNNNGYFINININIIILQVYNSLLDAWGLITVKYIHT